MAFIILKRLGKLSATPMHNNISYSGKLKIKLFNKFILLKHAYRFYNSHEFQCLE